jgi:hypothetical protein
MEYGIGIVLALVISFLARLTGFDRDRVFYPMVLVAVAHYYVLFAVLGGSSHSLMIESLVMAAFLCAAYLGFKFNLWLVAAALAGHGVFDFVHAHLVTNPGVPVYWPAFCMAYDVSAAGILAWLLKSSAFRAAGTGRDSKDSH